MRRIGVAVAVVLAGQPARADKVDKVVDKVEETIDDIRRLNRSIDMVVEVAYALSNPEELRLAPSRLYQTLLDDPVMAALVENIVNQYRGGYVQVAFDAGVTADLTTPGAVTASLDASYELPLCRVLGVTASGLGGYEDGEALATYAVGGTACLPLPANTLQVSYTRRDNVRTTLLAQPVVLRDRRTDDLVDIMIRGYRYLSKSNQIDVMPFDLGIDVTRSAEDTGFGAQDVDLRVMPVAWYRKGKGLAGGNQSFRFFSVAAKFHQDDRSLGDRNGFVANISPLVVDGVHLAPDVTAGLDLGWSVSDAYDGDTKLIERTDVHTEAWVATSQKPLAAEFRASHGLLPTYGGQLVLEDRVAARVELASPFAALRVNGFVGRAAVLREASMPKNPGITVAGTGADVALAVKKRVSLVGRLEVARSLAPGLDDEVAHKQFDVRATVGVTTHFDKRW